MNWPNDVYTVEKVAKILCEQSGGDWERKYTKRKHWTALAWKELAKFDKSFALTLLKRQLYSDLMFCMFHRLDGPKTGLAGLYEDGKNAS